MAKSSIKLTSEIREVLENADFSTGWMVLPKTPIYAKVKQFLEAAGAVWNRKAKGHLWNDEIQARYQMLLEEGGFINKKVLHQQFFTPDALGERLFMNYIVSPHTIGLHPSQPPLKILEPNAGSGNLVKVLRRRYMACHITAVEIDPEFIPALEAENVNIVSGDFLQLEPTPERLVDLVYMNPPFTNGQDIDHVVHAFRFLKPGGQLFAIMSGGWMYTGGKKYDSFRKLHLAFGKTLEQIPEGAFKESGTNVRTLFIKLTHPNF